MERHSLTLLELLALQAYLGAPVILGAAAFVGYYLRSQRRTGYLRVGVTCTALAVAATLAATVLWNYWPAGLDIMALEFVNLPAAAACLVLTSLTVWLAP